MKASVCGSTLENNTNNTATQSFYDKLNEDIFSFESAE